MKLLRMVAFLMCFILLLTLYTVNTAAQTTITGNETGTHDGYDYEYWKDEGDGTMILEEGGTFSCEWNNVNNILFRKGKKYDETQTHQDLGNITMDYSCDYNPDGNSYLSVYGWTTDPLVEFYVIESWGNWRPPGEDTPKETITVDGDTYDIYETTRTNKPSIEGTATFQQYWSVRQDKRTDGTIPISEHFEAWEELGMEMGNMYEIAFVVEGYQSSGEADVTSMSIDVGDSDNDDNEDNDDEGKLGDVNDDGAINSTDFSLLIAYILGSNDEISNADLNADGIIDSNDNALLQGYILGDITSFPGE